MRLIHKAHLKTASGRETATETETERAATIKTADKAVLQRMHKRVCKVLPKTLPMKSSPPSKIAPQSKITHQSPMMPLGKTTRPSKNRPSKTPPSSPKSSLHRAAKSKMIKRAKTMAHRHKKRAPTPKRFKKSPRYDVPRNFLIIILNHCRLFLCERVFGRYARTSGIGRDI